MKILDVPQSGSVAGVTSSRNRYGQYRRTKAIPVNPNSPKQAAVRANFGTLSTLWQQLDDGARTEWKDWADTHTFTDSLGQSITLSGFAWFMRAGQSLFAVGQAATGVAPTTDNAVDPGIAIASLTTSAMTVSFTAAIPTGGFLEVQATPDVSQGRYFAQGFRTIAVEQDDATSPLNVSAAYNGVFGGRAAGNRLWVRVRSITAEGVASPWSLATRVVA